MAVFLITALANIGGAVLFFMLLISLNGFTGKQAEPGLILFVVWVLLASIVTGVLGFFAANYLIENKSFNRWLAASLTILIFIGVGAAFNFVGLIAAAALTPAMR